MITRQKLRELNQDINDALVEVGKRHGVTLRTGNTSFSPQNATIKLEANTIDEDGNSFDQQAEDFKTFASGYGFKPEDLGKEFSSNGKRFKITGINTRAHKTPILGVDVRTGKKYRFGTQIKLLINS